MMLTVQKLQLVKSKHVTLAFSCVLSFITALFYFPAAFYSNLKIWNH